MTTASDPAVDLPDVTALGGDSAPAADATAETVASDPDASGEAVAVVPEAYDLVAPEGVTLDAETIAAATPVFKELGLSNDGANKLIPVAAAFAQRIQDQHNQQILTHVVAERQSWLDSAKSDAEIGGANWDKSINAGAAALDALGFTKGSPFRNLLNESGLGNHPEMIRAFAKVGAAIGNDSQFVRAGNSAAKRSAAETLYPDDQPKQGA